MVREVRLRQLIDAFQRDLPALTIELGRLYLAEAPDDATALAITGQGYAAVARYAEAQAAYERALELCAPDRRARVLSLLGAVYQARSEIQKAEGYYRRAIEHAPDDASAYIYLGAMLAKVGRLAEAEALHRRATACAEGCIDEAYLNLGFVLRAQGRYLDALESFREAVARDPTDEEAQDAVLDMESVLFRFPEA